MVMHGTENQLSENHLTTQFHTDVSKTYFGGGFKHPHLLGTV